jgi:hypothetical protein
LALWGGFPAFSSPPPFFSSSFRLPFFLVGAGFDIKWDSPARKNVKDKKNSKNESGRKNKFGKLGGPKGTQGSRMPGSCSRQGDGSRQI